VERLERDLATLAAIGASGPGAVTRLALTPADREARRWFIERCRELGMAVRIDRFGNMAGVLGAWDRPALLVGSHLDSARWGVATMGSKGLSGGLPAEELLALEDRDGVSFGEALAANAGYDLVGADGAGRPAGRHVPGPGRPYGNAIRAQPGWALPQPG
jgi:hypothetical protein